MQIEAGKYYKTVGGAKVGPMKYDSERFHCVTELTTQVWNGMGHVMYEQGDESQDYIVSEWVDEEVGTLAELGVKVGDVVASEATNWDSVTIERPVTNGLYSDGGWYTEECGILCGSDEIRIISRADNATPTPKTWGEMTDAEKGALLLAHHEGDVIEYGYGGGEFLCAKSNDGKWVESYTYRIKPEPKRETVILGWSDELGVGNGMADDDTHRITFNTIDGKPDCGSVKMVAV